MGAVYLAVHPTLGRKAAAKILHPQFARDQAVVARFINEAKAANAVRHPNIVDILDFGTLPEGTPYLLMEYLEGETVAGRLGREGRFPVAQAVGIAEAVAAALEAVHAGGIIHRDLKPENLFLAVDPGPRSAPGGFRLKVLDFGIAKLSVGGLPTNTRTGVVLGTPFYMSPEQCYGAGIGRRPRRRLRPGDHPLRDAVRGAALPERVLRRGARDAHDGGASAAVAEQPGDPPGPRGGRAAGAREAARRPLRLDG